MGKGKGKGKTRRGKRTQQKTRRQRGGHKIRLSVRKSRNNGSNRLEEMNVDIGETTTPRNVFEIFRRESLNAQRLNRPLFKENGTTPRFRLKSNQVKPFYWPAVSRNDWNVQGKNFQPGKLYYFDYIDVTPEELRAFYRNMLSHLGPVLEHYQTRYGGAKFIPGSSAATPDIPKNVKQQFKFAKSPTTPIVLVDSAFFMPFRYEFYKYLKFDEDVELSRALDPTGDIVKVFKKPAGKPFEINPDASDIALSKENKEAYLAEVNKQRVGSDEKVLFDQNDALEICCVKIPIEGLDDLVRRGSFFDLIDSYGNRPDGSPVFPAYTFLE
jgi:hypothetical protein